MTLAAFLRKHGDRVRIMNLALLMMRSRRPFLDRFAAIGSAHRLVSIVTGSLLARLYGDAVRRCIAIGAAALIVVLGLTFCCLSPIPASSCCKGHCVMSRPSPPAIAIAPLKTAVPQPMAGAIPVRDWTVAPDPVPPAAWRRFEPIVTIQLRI